MKNSIQTAKISQLWAQSAVLIGQSLSGGGKPTDGMVLPVSLHTPTDEAFASEIAKVKKFMANEKNLSAVTTSENISQFQSRLLYGALALNDEQWRQVNRTLAAYYQEGYARKLNHEARPQADTERWQQQRADLSSRAFAAINARLAPEQSVQFCKLCPRENWLWAMDVGVGASEPKKLNGLASR